MSSPHMVGHVHLKVRNIDISSSFYTDVLGLEVTEDQGRFRFLSWGERHHDVALQEISPNAPGPSPGVGLYHAAFEVADPRALTEIYGRLQDRGVPVSPVDHGISKALYFQDPDGNGLEVYLDTRTVSDQEKWKGRNTLFDPEKISIQ